VTYSQTQTLTRRDSRNNLVHSPFLALQSITAAWNAREFIQNPLTKIILVCLLGRKTSPLSLFQVGAIVEVTPASL